MQQSRHFCFFKMGAILHNLLIITIITFFIIAVVSAENHEESFLSFSPANASSIFTLLASATVSTNPGALQITPDSMNNAFSLQHKSGRAVLSRSFKLWDDDDDDGGSTKVASFNSTYLINIYNPSNATNPGEGFAFIIAPDLTIPSASEGQYLGLTNATTDGNSSNYLIAIELDTEHNDFDPDDNHMGLNINSIRSNKTVSLTRNNITIISDPDTPANWTVWVQYDGLEKELKVYMAPQGRPLRFYSSRFLFSRLDLNVNSNDPAHLDYYKPYLIGNYISEI